MLKNLIKYDLKKIYKYLIWFYLISISLAIIARIIGIWNNIQVIQILGSIFQSLTYSAIATIIINTFIHILLRFSISFYKDQSYLIHTLPIKKDTLILSKYLSSLIIILSSILVSFLSLFILFYSKDFMQNLKIALDSISSGFNFSSGLFLSFCLLIIFSQICAIISFAFTAIIKGYSYNHKRGIKGFLWFVLYYVSCLITTLIISVIITAITGNLSNLFANQMTTTTLLIVMIIAFITYCSFTLYFYFKSKSEFKKGVNVD